jgi:hypothetical protein
MGENESQYTPPEHEQGLDTEDSPERESAEIIERVTEHSREWDRKIAKSTPEVDIQRAEQAFVAQTWRIGNSEIRAIGVEHLPETFLVARKEIERAIGEADIVVNEFAPEALGFYQDSQIDEEVERRLGMGSFHHEIELLAASHGKDMAAIDLTHGKSYGEPEVSATDMASVPFPSQHDSVEYKHMLRSGLKEGGQALAAAILATWGLAPFLHWVSNGERKMSRRDFIKGLGLTAASVAIGHSALSNFSRDRGKPIAPAAAPPNFTDPSSVEKKDEQIEYLRDPIIADSLRRLSRDGYRKVVLIYGANHLPKVKRYLDEPQECEEELSSYKDLIDQYNPDRYKIFRLAPGENHSERFVASRKMVWQRIDQTLEAE